MKQYIFGIMALVAFCGAVSVQAIAIMPPTSCENGLSKTTYPNCTCPEGQELTPVFALDSSATCVDVCPEGKIRSACQRDDGELVCVADAAPFCNCLNGATDAACTTCPIGFTLGNGKYCMTTPSEGVACTLEYAPVCGSDGQTYGNACAAKAAGVVIVYENECPGNTPPVACTKEYMPVCAAYQVQCITTPCPPIMTTYDNACLAKAAGATLQYPGSCATDALSDDQLVSRAHTQGLTKYDTVEAYRFDALILREEAARMFVAFAKEVLGNTETTALPADFAKQLDSATDETLRAYVLEAFMYNIFNRTLNTGTEQRFYPKNHLTKAQALAMLMRLANKREDETITPWYKNYIISGVTLKWFTTAEFADAEAPITRGELITWMQNIKAKK